MEEPAAHSGASHEDELDLLVRVGEALAISGESIDGIRTRLESIGRARGVPDMKLVVLPASLWVQTGTAGATDGRFTSFTNRDLRLDQIADVDQIADSAHDPTIPPDSIVERLEAVMHSPPRFGGLVRSIGLGLLAAGFSLSLQPSLGGALAAFVLGVLVGFIKLVRAPSLRATIPVLASFVVAVIVFGLAEQFDTINPLRVLIPPLVTFLPGAALTTGMRDLATGQVVSGASRLVQGVVVSLMLAVGIVSAAALTGTPSAALIDRPIDRLGPWAPWAGLLLITLGTWLHRCAHRSSLPWILIVLIVAYTAQSIAAVTFDAQLSSFFGALAMTPATLWIARLRRGPTYLVTYLPAFWMLVPGGAGLIGMTEIVGTDSVLGPADFLTVLGTVTEISLGVLLGTTLFQTGADELPGLAHSLPGPRTVRRWWHWPSRT